MSRRVAVTGVGIVTSLGSSAPETFARLLRGERGFSAITLFDTAGQRTGLGAEVQNFRASDVTPRGVRPVWSRSDALALVAAREALSSSPGAVWRGMGLSVGITTGGMLEAEQLLPRLTQDAPREAIDRLVSYPPSSTADRLEETLGPFIRVATICSACSSGANAIAQAATWIDSGQMESALAGGTDALCLLTLTGFNALGATDTGPCRPFDRDRAGLTLGEGAAFVVLESEETVVARGGRVLAWLSGWAALSEAHHITQPDPTGRAGTKLLLESMRRAGLRPEDIDYVNAHGTGTIPNDAAETLALRAALGEEADRVFVSSSKGQLGHTLGAAGALEAAITVLSLAAQRVPPTGGLSKPADDCHLRHVMGEGISAELRSAISSSFGFGGAGTTLLFEQRDAVPRAQRNPRVRVEITGLAAFDASGLTVGSACADLLRPRVLGGSIARDLQGHLQASRSRRFDRLTTLTVIGAEEALTNSGVDREGAGLVASTAFGNPSRTAEFLKALAEKGPRRAPPAEFPHLVPSSLAGNASIYLGLSGAAAATSDLETGGETAVLMAMDWIAADVASAVVAGGAEVSDGLVTNVLAPACEPNLRSPRVEGSAWIVLERAGAAGARGATPSAEVLGGYQVAASALSEREIPAPRGGHPVIVASGSVDPVRDLLGRCGWGGAAEKILPAILGRHEAMGALAVAVAAALVARKDATDVLVVGMRAARATLIHLAEPS